MFKELLTISEYPNLSLLSKSTFVEKTGRLLKIYGLVFLVIILVVPLILATDQFVTHVLHFKAINQVQKNEMSHFFHKLGYWKAALYICLVGPLLEEIVFRLPLSLKKKHIAIAFAAAAAFLFAGFLFRNITSQLINFGIRLSISAAIYFICIFLVPNNLSIIDHRFRKQLIILSMCLFGLMHIGNYSPIQWPLILLYPIYIIPQLCMGWGITYLRFKNGFWWGFALHCIINSVSVLLSAGRV
ncbi:CPBP family glutamic-type intramembrane protease [Mucilaginibacter sp.]|uniref:CPBP family glutamic-type intramembrane protease n=1 Tax=Mucilaginibacter sp. TaxID=1882438 RepID=UPI00262DE1C3|nr:CPBP family glutamic-type intramembrane protease [Mucilaginibacter sp.]MDB4923669.1 protease self-immunity [Mucilaginibacter sp.]